MIEGEALRDHEKYLVDESRRTGRATALTFPRTTAEVCGALQAARERGLAVTVSGARTGIAAGAVPDGGMLLSLERMSRICGVRKAKDGAYLVRCEAGAPLADLQRSVRTGVFADSATWDAESLSVLEEMKGRRLFYPPDPTETSAAIGGTVACNASGAHSFRYGATRSYVHWLRVVLADGRRLDIERGAVHPDEHGRFFLKDDDGRLAPGQAPSYAWPATKNAAGYFSGPDLDLIDLFIGSEGTLGIITEAELRVIAAPETSCATTTFWPDEGRALEFTQRLRTYREELGVEAIEYFDPNALELLRARRRQVGPVSGVPACLPDSAACAVYVDIGLDANELGGALERLAALVRDSGSDPDQCWSAAEQDERERLRIFRHALPETVNARIAEIRQTHPEVTKLGTDMAAPDERLADVVRMYRTGLDAKGLDYVMFGHIGDNHLHVNILPRTPAEYAAGWDLYHSFAEKVVAMGGSPAAEHGIGKLKTDFLRTLYGDEGVAQMLAIKKLFDPDLRLGRGTLFG